MRPERRTLSPGQCHSATIPHWHLHTHRKPSEQVIMHRSLTRFKKSVSLNLSNPGVPAKHMTTTAPILESFCRRSHLIWFPIVSDGIGQSHKPRHRRTKPLFCKAMTMTRSPHRPTKPIYPTISTRIRMQINHQIITVFTLTFCCVTFCFKWDKPRRLRRLRQLESAASRPVGVSHKR